jgi:hypothetical protein
LLPLTSTDADANRAWSDRIGSNRIESNVQYVMQCMWRMYVMICYVSEGS